MLQNNGCLWNDKDKDIRWRCCVFHSNDLGGTIVHHSSVDKEEEQERALLPKFILLPERFGRQDAEARLLQHLPDLVASARHSVGLHFAGALVVCGELHVAGEVRDGEAVAFFLLDLRDVGAAVLLLVHNPAEELFED